MTHDDAPPARAPRRGRVARLARPVLVLALAVASIAALEGAARLVFRWKVGLPFTGRGTHLAEAASPVFPDRELALRMFHEVESVETPFDPWTLYRNAPYDGELVRVSAQGFRDGPVAVEKPAGRVRVVAIGGSIVFGWGASSNAATIPARCERLLRERLPGCDLEVVNAGVKGFVSGQDLAFFVHRVAELDPDAVLLLHGWNDFYGGMFVHPDRPGVPWGTRDAERAIDRPLAHLYSRLREESAFCFLLDRVGLLPDLDDRRPEGRDVEATADEVARVFWRNVDALVTLARARGVRVVAALQPALGAGRKPLTAEERAILDEASGWWSGEDFREALAAVYARLREGYAERAGRGTEGVRWLDLTGAFDGERETLYFDPVHVGDAGNAILAAELAESAGALLAPLCR